MADKFDRFPNDLKHLLTLKELLDGDQVLPVRIHLERQSLDFRRFTLTLSGVEGLAIGTNTFCKVSSFLVWVEVPPGYPKSAPPNICFIEPIPFHPHVWTNGVICWGEELRNPQPNMFLVDWFKELVKYIAYEESKINSGSPANGQALDWWQQHRRSLGRYVAPLDMPRLRFWVDKAKW